MNPFSCYKQSILEQSTKSTLLHATCLKCIELELCPRAKIPHDMRLPGRHWHLSALPAQHSTRGGVRSDIRGHPMLSMGYPEAPSWTHKTCQPTQFLGSAAPIAHPNIPLTQPCSKYWFTSSLLVLLLGLTRNVTSGHLPTCSSRAKP